jgi:hypothetical protein
MRVRLEIEGLNGHWDVDMPYDHSFAVFARQKVRESGKVGWDAVAKFQGALRDCISDELTLEIIPDESKERHENL